MRHFCRRSSATMWWQLTTQSSAHAQSSVSMMSSRRTNLSRERLGVNKNNQSSRTAADPTAVCLGSRLATRNKADTDWENNATQLSRLNVQYLLNTIHLLLSHQDEGQDTETNVEFGPKRNLFRFAENGSQLESTISPHATSP